MWELCNSEGKPREFVVTHAKDRVCGLCKMYLRSGETYYMIMIPNGIRGTHKRLIANMIVHIDEWQEFCNGVTTDAELAEKLINHKVKAKNKLTETESAHLEAFKQACRKYNFTLEVAKPYGCRMRQRGTSVYIEYNVYTDTIDVGFRGKRGLFDSFYQKQVVVNIYNVMHEILADGRHIDYDCQESINNVMQKAIQQVNEIL